MPNKLSWALVTLVTLAYPAAVYYGHGHVPPYWLATALVGLAVVRAWVFRDVIWLITAVGAASLALATFAGGGWVSLKLYPLLVNAVLLAVFLVSLLRPPTVIERLARLSEPSLSEAGVAYTRAVTWLWCGFFSANGTVALVTARWASNEIWALYNGFVSYVLMGGLFLGEWLVRQRVKSRSSTSTPQDAHG